MNILKTVVIVVLLLKGLHAHAQNATAYIHPAFKADLDTSVWKFDLHMPSFWMVNGYLQKDEIHITNKSSQTTYKIIVHIIPDTISLTEIDKFLNHQFKKEYKNVYSVSENYYGGKSYQMIFEQGFIIHIEALNKRGAIKTEELFPLLDQITCIGTAAFDRLAGYPLPAHANEDSLKTLRREWFFEANPQLKNKVYIDHLLLMDKYLGFTFTEWAKHMAKEQGHLYSEEEMALADGQIQIPYNVQWLRPFMPNYNFNLNENSYKELRRHVHRKHPETDYHVKHISERKNPKGISYIIYCDDTVRLFNVHCDKTKNEISSYTYSIIQAEDETDPLMIDSKWNDRYWQLTHLNYSGSKYLVEEFKQHARETKDQPFTKSTLHGCEIPLDSCIAFGVPTNWSSYSMVAEVRNEPVLMEYQIEALHSKPSRFEIGNLPNFRFFHQQNTAGQKDKKGVLIKSHLLFSDIDQDKFVEYTIGYLANGEVIYSETYEINANGVEKIDATKVWPSLAKRKDIVEMFYFSLHEEALLARMQPSFGYEEVAGYDYVYSDDIPSGDYYGGAMEAVEEPYYDVHPVAPPEVFEAHACAIPAAFPGGEKAIQDYFKQNIKLPQVSENDLEVFVTIVVETNGKLSIEKSLNSNGKTDEFTAEARRLLVSMPAWTPAERNGKKVRMRKVIAVPFGR